MKPADWLEDLLARDHSHVPGRAQARSAKEEWWPTITDQRTARTVARQSFWAAIFVIAASVVHPFLVPSSKSLLGTTVAGFVGAGLFSGIALGLLRMSRIAAVAGLAVFVFEKALAFRSLNSPVAIIVALAILFAFVQGVRATFAFHGLRTVEANATELSPLPRV